jgi:hypothetical protein
MNIQILKQVSLDHISSASCVEFANGNIYIVGDDNNYLYVLKYDLSVLTKIPLESTDLNKTRIEKKSKKDIECITKITINGYVHLLLMGSGSIAPNRCVAYLIKLPTPYSKKHHVQKIDLTAWFDFLKMNDEITGPSGMLNFEGLACDQEYLYLANRESNVLLRLDQKEMVEFLQGHMDGFPFPTIIHTEIGHIPSSVPFQITGADYFDHTFFVTAAAEDTNNPIDDGEIMDSLIARIQIPDFNKSAGMFNQTLTATTIDYCLMPTVNQQRFKMESICIYEKDLDTYVALAVSDNDNGASDLFLLEIK